MIFTHTAMLTLLLIVISPISAQQVQKECNSIKNEKDNTLRIGVRKHARPFSYHSEKQHEVWSASPQTPLALVNYTGYMSKICDAVLAEMVIDQPNNCFPFDYNDVEVVDVDCLIKNKITPDEDDHKCNVDNKTDSSTTNDKDHAGMVADNRTRPKVSRFAYLGKQIDILCDPATITNARRHGFILSPPLFLSGIGLINRGAIDKETCPKIPLIGYVGNTTAADSGIIKVLQTNQLKSYAKLLRDYVRTGNNICSDAFGDVEIVKN
ncbi:MAG: hypothetical protein V7782_07445, partial [Psychromonas sp.]